MTLLRSGAFALALVLLTPPYALVALGTFFLPRVARYRELGASFAEAVARRYGVRA